MKRRGVQSDHMAGAKSAMNGLLEHSAYLFDTDEVLSARQVLGNGEGELLLRWKMQLGKSFKLEDKSGRYLHVDGKTNCPLARVGFCS